jgi:hypothetical protein
LFIDTHAERDYLTAKIYPKLRKILNEKYNLDLMVIDLRWGIPGTPSEMVLSDVCFNEIKNCQNISAGPNFVALLSERYGYRMLPADIPDKDFSLIKNEIEKRNLFSEFDILKVESKQLKEIIEAINFKIDNLLLNCYSKNENMQPNVYVLKDLIELIPKDEKEEINKNLIISYCGDTIKRTKLYKDIEWEVKLQLHSLLRNIVKDLDSLSEFEKDNYFVSGIIILIK